MTKAELLNLIKACFITWSCDEYNGKGYGEYKKMLKDYDKELDYLVSMELPEDPYGDIEDWENEDYSYILDNIEHSREWIKRFMISVGDN